MSVSIDAIEYYSRAVGSGQNSGGSILPNLMADLHGKIASTPEIPVPAVLLKACFSACLCVPALREGHACFLQGSGRAFSLSWHGSESHFCFNPIHNSN